MDFLFLTHVYYYPYNGGTIAQVHGLSDYLYRKGHNVSIVCGNQRLKRKPSLHPFLTYGQEGGKKVFRCATHQESGAWTMIPHPKIFGLKPDIVHIYPYNIPFLELSGVFLKKAASSRIVLTTGGSRFSQERSIIGKLYDKTIGALLLENVDRTIVFSDAEKRDIEKHFGLRDEDTEIISCGIDDIFFEKTGTNLKEKLGIKGGMVLFVGRPDPIKGLHVLIEAFDLVSKKMPDAKLVIIGAPTRDTSAYQELVERMIRQFKLQGKIIKLGFVKPSLLRDAYASCDVFTMPSIYEAQGTVELEAMACGAPIVASDTGGVPFTLNAAKTGILVPPGNPVKLAEALLRVLEDRDTAKKSAEKGRHYAKQNFSWDVVGKTHIELYEHVLKR